MTSDGGLVNILRLPGSGERSGGAEQPVAPLDNTLKGVGSSVEEAD